MIRILQYVSIMDIGGMENLLMSFYRNLDRNKIQFDFAVNSNKVGFYDEEIISMGGRIFHFPQMRKNPIAYKRLWKLFWKEHKNEYNYFSFNCNCLSNTIALNLAKKAGIKNICIHAHSTYANKGKLQIISDLLHKINQKKLKNKTRQIACSKEASIWMFGKKNNASIVYSGIDYDRYAFNKIERELIRTKYGLKENDICVIQVGHLLPVKNYEFSIKIAHDLIVNDKRYKFFFIGDGSEKNKLINSVSSLNIQDNVFFLGSRNDVPSLLCAADIFIMPSIFEGFGMSAVEAQVSGLYCFLSNEMSMDVCVSDRTLFLPIDDKDTWVNELLSVEHYSNRFVSIDKKYDIKNILDVYLYSLGVL